MFETVYGPQGGWARLFQCDSHYRETRLLRDVSGLRCYFTLDNWDTEQSFEAFRAAHQAAFAELGRSTGGLTIFRAPSRRPDTERWLGKPADESVGR